jgi:Helix-turn-helix domain
MSQNIHTIQQVAIATGISETNLRNFVQRDKIKVYRLGRLIYIDTATLEALKRKEPAVAR